MKHKDPKVTAFYKAVHAQVPHYTPLHKQAVQVAVKNEAAHCTKVFSILCIALIITYRETNWDCKTPMNMTSR